jgi:predicted DNA-binding ribbon-helix-helix protein
MDEELYTQIIETAKEEERNMSSLVRLAIKEYLERKQQKDENL